MGLALRKRTAGERSARPFWELQEEQQCLATLENRLSGGLLAGKLQLLKGVILPREPGRGHGACFRVPGNPKWTFL